MGGALVADQVVIDRLKDLRRRVVVCVIAIGIGFAVAFWFKEALFAWLIQPMVRALPEIGMRRLVYTAPHEAFLCYLKVALVFGTGFAFPVLAYEFWRLVVPGLYEEAKFRFFMAVSCSVLFFLGGVLFAYYAVFNQAFQFFTSFSGKTITPMIRSQGYFHFAAQILFAFGLIFELPVFIYFCARLGLVNAALLRRRRRFAVLIIFIVAAILTPTPDAMTQLMMATPLMILYEASIWVARFAARSPVPEAGS